MADRRTGYYVAGRDWPAMGSGIPLEDLYRGLEGITEEGPALMSDQPPLDAIQAAAYAVARTVPPLAHNWDSCGEEDIKREALTIARAALEAAAPAIRADERAKWTRIEPDPDQPGYNRGVFDISAMVTEAVAVAVAAERERLRQAAADMQASVYDRDRDEWMPLADLMTDLPPADRERSEAEAEFIAASVAVWREIDRINANPGGYHPTKMSVELRDRERAAWNRYRDLLEPAP